MDPQQEYLYGVLMFNNCFTNGNSKHPLFLDIINAMNVFIFVELCIMNTINVWGKEEDIFLILLLCKICP